MSFSIDTDDIKDLERSLKAFAFRSLPFATKKTLNDAAWDGRRFMQRNIEKKMTERNKWTRGSIRVEQARTLVIKKQSSAFGSTEKYMIIQEDGGTERGKGSQAIAIPTGYAAGQQGARPRTKLPRKPHKMRNIRLTKSKTKSPNRKLRNFLVIKEAKARGIKYVFLDLGRRRGIFRVLGSKKRPKLKMVADISQRSIRIKPTPTLQPAFKAATKGLDDHYRKNLIFQLKRAKILR